MCQYYIVIYIALANSSAVTEKPCDTV